VATRLREAWDPRLRSIVARRGVEDWVERTGIPRDEVPFLPVSGQVGLAVGERGIPLVEHASNPLRVILRRFNAYSNNDIARLQAVLGPPAALDAYLRQQLEPTEPWHVDSLSGLGDDRLTPRGVVAVLHWLRQVLGRHGLSPADVLPRFGCEPGTLERFRLLGADAVRGAVAAKTGTLVTTAGGVAALAGYAETATGSRLFAVVAPRSGKRLSAARAAEEAWLLGLLAAEGGAVPASCGPPLPFSDDAIELRTPVAPPLLPVAP
jgi:D-alanyl-D-alanine carboxypeptidase/D-alanyl-D-alanine-endopeptidase (penicillin-binding protein 4)